MGTHDRAAIPPWPNWDDDYAGKPRRYPRLVNSFFAQLPATWPDWQQVIGLVYDYTTQVDAEIGRLLDRLDELGLTDETLIVFASDHGDMIGSHGLHDKGYMYEEAHRIPLMLRLPGQAEARTSDALVYNMDIFPTILDLVGDDEAGEDQQALDGQSLLPFLSEEAEPGAERDALYLEFHGIRYLRTERAIVTRDGLKYIFNPADDDELYDLNADPAELHNLLAAGGSAPQADALRARLVELAQQHGDPVQNCIAKWFGAVARAERPAGCFIGLCRCRRRSAMSAHAQPAPRLHLAHRQLAQLAQHPLQQAAAWPDRDTITVCCWFHAADTAPAQVLLNQGHRTVSEPGWSIFLCQGEIVASLHGGADLVARAAPISAADAWHHVAVVFDRATPALTAYLDGSAAPWHTTTASLQPGGEPARQSGLGIGGYTDAAGGHFNYTFGRRLHDRMDDLRIYGHELGPEAIAAFVRLDGDPPSASFTVDCAQDDAPTRAAFDATAAVSPQDPFIAHWWDFGDGHQAEGPTVEHNYAYAGVYPVRLTVLDSRHKQAQSEQTLTLTGQSAPIRFTAVFVNGEGGYAAFRIPCIVAATNGDLVAFAEGRVESVSDSTQTIHIVCKRSRDQGRTWTPLQVVGRHVIDGADYAAMNPSAVVDGLRGTGRIVLLYKQLPCSEWALVQGEGVARTVCVVSDDHGVSWRDEREITNAVHRPDRWRVQIPTAGHAIQLRGTADKPFLHGRLFFIGSHTTDDDSVFEQRNYAFWSDDLGQTWQMGPEIDVRADGTTAQGLNEAMAVELSDGRIVINSRNYQLGQAVGCRAVTLGEFDRAGQLQFEPTRHDATLIEPPCQASIVRHDARDRERTVLLFANPAHGAARVNMTVRVSRDDGESWPVAKVIDPGPSAYSDLVIQSDGEIGLLYERGNDGGIWYAGFGLDWLEQPPG